MMMMMIMMSRKQIPYNKLADRKEIYSSSFKLKLLYHLLASLVWCIHFIIFTYLLKCTYLSSSSHCFDITMLRCMAGLFCQFVPVAQPKKKMSGRVQNIWKKPLTRQTSINLQTIDVTWPMADRMRRIRRLRHLLSCSVSAYDFIGGLLSHPMTLLAHIFSQNRLTRSAMPALKSLKIRHAGWLPSRSTSGRPPRLRTPCSRCRVTQEETKRSKKTVRDRISTGRNRNEKDN